MSSTFKSGLSVSIFGESHGRGIGVVLDNLPAGETIDLEEVEHFLRRRSPGSGIAGSSARKESDVPNVLSGLYQGKTTGTPLSAIFDNKNIDSNDYESIKDQLRPGHADFTAYYRYHGFQDPRGGGHFSGRLTAPLTFAGAICEQILKRRGVIIAAHISEIHGILDSPFDSVNPNTAKYYNLRNKKFPVLNDLSGKTMQQEILSAKQNGDSVGGVIECIAVGIPPGIGSPIFDGMENELARLLFAIPAMRGLEFGAGFSAAKMTGSEHNDSFTVQGDSIRTVTNHHGGVLGGITSGMPLLFRVCIKPTPSIQMTQQTVNYQTKQQEHLSVPGRHDACILPRVVPVIEAVTAIALLSQWQTP